MPVFVFIEHLQLASFASRFFLSFFLRAPFYASCIFLFCRTCARVVEVFGVFGPSLLMHSRPSPLPISGTDFFFPFFPLACMVCVLKVLFCFTVPPCPFSSPVPAYVGTVFFFFFLTSFPFFPILRPFGGGVFSKMCDRELPFLLRPIFLLIQFSPFFLLLWFPLGPC